MLDTRYAQVNPGPPKPSRILTPRDMLRKSGMELSTEVIE